MTVKFIKSLCPCLLGIVLGSAQAQTVSFTEAWSRVIQQDDGLAAEQAGVERAQQLREAAKAMYLPKVDVGPAIPISISRWSWTCWISTPSPIIRNSARCWGL